MKTITKERAQSIASKWHGGQGSALYSFASTGKFYIPFTLQYFKEIWSEIEPEYWHANEVSISEKNKRELNSLKTYLLKQAEENGVSVEFAPSVQYGYQIPYLKNSVSDELVNRVNPVKYLP